MSQSSFMKVSPTLEEVGGASWTEVWHYICWCTVTQIVFYGVAWIVNTSLWEAIAEKNPKFVKRYVGRKEDPPTNLRAETILRWMQLASSLATVVFWVYKTYAFRVSMWVFIIELFFSFFYIVTFLLELARYEFDPGRVLSFNATLDVWTIMPLLLQKGGGPACQDLCPRPCWISFSYLRCIRVLAVWTEIEGSGMLDNVTEFTRGIITTVIKFLVIVVFFSGTMFIFETLGDISTFADRTMETEMGHTSFLALCYFTFVTISTVGYGDFSPVSVLGRLFVIVVILGGVGFFTVETGRIMDIIKMSASGKGRFTPRKPRCKHVLVIGGGVNGSISVLESFLRSLVDPSHGEDIPEVVLMGPKGPDEEMVALLAQRWATRANIKYLWGNCAQRVDLHRARIEQVQLCFVLADVNTRHAQEEDLQNIIRGSAVYRMFKTPLLVMMLEAKNIKFAVQTGIPERMCVGLDDLEITTLASSAQCLGLSTIVINLALPDLEAPDEYSAEDKWLEEYIDGANKELYGLQLKTKYHHKTFTEAAKDVYNSCGVMLIACQDDSGALLMNPGNRFVIKPATVFFCIADDEDALESIRYGDGRDWLDDYEKTRANFATMRLRELRRLAASHDRPALLAIEPQEPQEPHDDDKEDKKPAAAHSKANTRSIRSTPQRKPETLMSLPGKPMSLPGKPNPRGPKSIRARQQQVQEEAESPPPVNVEQLFDDAEHVENEEALKSIVDEGGHLVVVGLTANLFPQLVSIIRQLRQQTYPKRLLDTPIIVLYSESLNDNPNIKKFLDGHKRVVYVRGSPLKLRSLITAGVDRASRLLMVANGSQDIKTSEPIMMDQEAILLLSVLESQRLLWGRIPDVICELQVPSNIRQLDEHYDEPAEEDKAPRTPSSVATQTEPSQQPATFSSQTNRTHARYATGGIILRAEFSSLFAAAYYTPGVLDLLKSMTQPPPLNNSEASIVWKVPCTADMMHKTFKEVFAELIEKDAIPIGLCRAPSKEMGTQLSWVYTCPDPATEIRDGDSVYLLASAEWVEDPRNRSYTRDLTGAYTPGRGNSSARFRPPLPERTCPQGHALKGLVTPQEGWGCDVCRASDVPRGSAMQGCKQCRWVCCLDCYATAPALSPDPIRPANHFSSRPSRPTPPAPASAPPLARKLSNESGHSEQPPSRGSRASRSPDGSRAGSDSRRILYESESEIRRDGPPRHAPAASHDDTASRRTSEASRQLSMSNYSDGARHRNGAPNSNSFSVPGLGNDLMSNLGNLLDVRKLVPPPSK